MKRAHLRSQHCQQFALGQQLTAVVLHPKFVAPAILGVAPMPERAKRAGERASRTPPPVCSPSIDSDDIEPTSGPEPDPSAKASPQGGLPWSAGAFASGGGTPLAMGAPPLAGVIPNRSSRGAAKAGGAAPITATASSPGEIHYNYEQNS